MKGLTLHINGQAPELCYATVRGVRISKITNGLHLSNLDWYHAIYKSKNAKAYIREKLFNKKRALRVVKIVSTREGWEGLTETRGGTFAETRQVLEAVKHLHREKATEPLLSGDILPASVETVTFPKRTQNNWGA